MMKTNLKRAEAFVNENAIKIQSRLADPPCRTVCYISANGFEHDRLTVTLRQYVDDNDYLNININQLGLFLWSHIKAFHELECIASLSSPRWALLPLQSKTVILLDMYNSELQITYSFNVLTL